MPVKRSTGTLIAVGLASFVAGALVSRRRCRSCSTNPDSDVRKWARLYLSVKKTPEPLDDAIEQEVKDLTNQLLDMYFKPGSDGSAAEYTLSYLIHKLRTVDGKLIIEVQFYTVRIEESKQQNYSNQFQRNVQEREPDSLKARSMDSGGATQRSFLADTTQDFTDHTPQQCPRPRPGLKTTEGFGIIGWVCD